MHITSRLTVGILAVAALWAPTQTGAAQASQAVTTMAPSTASADAVAPPAANQEQNDDDSEAKKHPMGWAGIGVKVGVASVGAGKASISGFEGRTDSRFGMQLAMPIHLGGDGASFTLEPYMAMSSVSHDTKDSMGQVTGSESVNLNAYGVYLGPTFNIHVARPVYVGFGFGIKGAYLANNAFDYAVDAYGRVPLHATYYVSNSCALVAEVGLGYGGSLFVDKPQVAVDVASRTARNVKDDPQFGTAFTWDASFGVRLP